MRDCPLLSLKAKQIPYCQVLASVKHILIKTAAIKTNQFPSGKSFFPDAEPIGFLSGNEEFFLLARKSNNYKEAYLTVDE